MQPTPVVSRSFVGRKDALAHLHERRRDASAAHGGLVLVAGEAGLGKSRLLLEFRKELARARVRVGASQCHEFAQRPYAPVLDALADLRRDTVPLEPAASRTIQFDEIARGFRDAARSRAIAVLIEDVHWADAASIELLWTIAREAVALRILLVATYRSEAIQDDHPLFAGIAKLQRLQNASSIDLEPLADRELRALIDGALLSASADIPYETRLTIARLSEGNPLFAEELLKTAVDRARAGATSPALPTTIRAAVLERMRPLDTVDQAVLAQAAVIGRKFTAELLDATVGEPRDRILEALRHARSLQLIEEEGAGEFSFHHALTREAIYESFLAAQVREFHARIAAAIETFPAQRRPLQDLAYHWWAASNAEKAAAYGEEAGDAAMAVYAYDEAARLFGYSLDSVDRRSSRAAELLIKIGLARGRNGLKTIATEALGEACEIYHAIGNLAGEVEARIEHAGGLYNRNVDAWSALEELRTRLLAPEHRRLRSRVDVALGQVYALLNRGDATAMLDSAEPDLDPADVRTNSIYHASRALQAAKISDIESYRAHTAASLKLARVSGVPNYEAVVLSNAARAMTDLARFDAADEYFVQAEAFAIEHKLLATLGFVYATRAKRRVHAGMIALAQADVVESAGLASDYEVARPFRATTGVQIGLLLDDEAFVDQFFDESQIKRGNPLQIAAPFAERLLLLGREDEANRLYDEALSNALDARAPFDLFVSIAKHAAPAIAERALRRARTIAEAPQDIVFKPIVELMEALAASRADDAAGAVPHAAKAAAAFHELGCPLMEAEALVLAGDSDAAAAIYRRTGAVALLRRMQLTEPGADGRRSARTIDALTVREREVVELIGRGHSNAEIAERMSVSLKTVEKHLSSIYVKLGINSRGKLMAHLFASQTVAP